MNCSRCMLPVSDAVSCSSCRGNLHYACAGVAETTYRKMSADKKAAWRCVTCRRSPTPDPDTMSGENQSSHGIPTGTPSNEMQQGFATVLKKIDDLRADFSSLKSDVGQCKDGIKNIETKMNNMETRFSDLEDRVATLEKKGDLVSKLRVDLNTATSIISTLQEHCDTREQYSRMNNIELSGLPFSKGENLISILQNIYTVVGLKYEEQHIDCVQRVRRFPTGGVSDDVRVEDGESPNARAPAVIIKFTRRIYKDQLLSAVRARRGITTSSIGINGPALNLYLGDHLTPASKMLLKRARELKKDNKLAYLWVRDCKILARRSESSKVMVINKNFDFNKIK